MKRKALTLLLFLSILVGMFTLSTIAATDNPFVDVDSNAYYFEPVLWAVEQGITTGTSENSFSPPGRLHQSPGSHLPVACGR